MSKTSAPETINVANEKMGYLYALGAVLVGVVAWVLLWKMGMIASIVAFIMAWGVIYLYKIGAKADVDNKSSLILIAMIVFGLIAAFAAGVVSDAWDAYSSATSGAVFMDNGFQEFLGSALSSGDVWSAYIGDMVVALVFGVIGSFSIIKDLVDRNKGHTVEKTASKS